MRLSLAPCSSLFRTLRAAVGGAASGILDSACARRSAGRQVGTKEWPPSRTKEWTSCGRRLLHRLVVGIVERLALERGAQHIEQSVADPAQSPRMTVSTPAQFGITRFARWVVLGGDAGPMIDGILQTLVAGVTSQHDALLAAAPGDRG